ncbi:MAG: glycoside hydrolase family 38 C-terminal domain-containing protein [Paracoccaceae bacterium]|nr:glycoside hydrolase family 38 C-terminal domain-containing protein [Paracoccaceae bacterium]
MSHRLRYTADKIGKRIALIRPFVHRRRKPITPFRFHALKQTMDPAPITGPTTRWPEIKWSSYWGGPDIDFVLRSSFLVPRGWKGPLALHLPMGVAGDIFTHPEALLYIDGAPVASADRYHHTIEIDARFADRSRHEIALHGWTGLSGWPPDPEDKSKLFMRECAIVELDETLEAFVSKAEAALDVARYLGDARPEKHRILNALDRAFLALDTRDPIGAALHASVPAALGILDAGLAEAGPPMEVDLAGIGHAHMDIAYLWPVDQIRLKNTRTYSNVLRLMEKHPEFHFSHSQPQLYQYTEEDTPDLFDAIRKRVAEGRWEVMGGAWVEMDANIPSAESLVRQLVLGRRYYREKFGEAETPVLWLPDTFGFPATLPQLMKLAGVRWFVTNKMSWNQYNPMPSSTTWWEGIDGSRVLAHFLTTPREVQHLPFPTNYKSDLTAPEVFGTWEKSTEKETVFDLPICFGYGDGGGGPTDALIRKAKALKSHPGAPRLRMTTVRDFFEGLEEVAGRLPVWTDELYMEGHRGVLTSQAWIKRANRRAEALLHHVEFLAAKAVAAGNPVTADLTRAWELLCLNQFHDILTGTSVPEVYLDARADYEEIEATARTVEDAALTALAPSLPAEAELLVVNDIPHGRNVMVRAPDDGLGFRDLDTGADLPCQKTARGMLVEVPGAAPYSLRALGRTAAPAGAETGLRAVLDGAGAVLENPLLRLRLDRSGRVVSLQDLAADREVITGDAPGNQLQLFEDRPISWDAWDIDAFFEDRREDIDNPVRFELIEQGPLRATVLVEHLFRRSRVRQRIQLWHNSRRIDFATELDWHESHFLLKAAFPVAVRSRKATYDIQWGTVERPTHRRTSWDYAMFEVPGHKWCDLSEAGYGVALLNDCKYGYDVRDSVMRLTLVKCATMPDPGADNGRHVFTYSLYPHTGGWTNGVRAAAADLNSRVYAKPVAATGRAGKGEPLVTVSRQNVIVETVKPADDGEGVVFRLYEAEGRRGEATLTFDRDVARATLTDLLEDPLAALPLVSDRALRVALGPHEIKTLRVAFAP